ncbi:MAG: Ig-like domain-containing protein, partial [Bacteroidota bacterium]
MYASINQLGSCVLEVDSNRMEVIFLNSAGTVADRFEVTKDFFEGLPPVVDMTAPTDGAYFPIAQNISLEANASDPDGIVEEVTFYADGQAVGSDNTTPFSVNWMLPSNGVIKLYAEARDDAQNVVRSDSIFISVGSVSGVVTVPIKTGADDAEEDAQGTVFLNNTRLALVNKQNVGDQLVGLHFDSLAIPPNAVITSAFLQFTSKNSGNNNPSGWKIFADDSYDSAPIVNQTGNLSNRPRTQTSINWLPANWAGGNAAGPDQRSPDLSLLIQELIDLPGWQENHAITLMVAGWGRRNAQSFEAGFPAYLQVHFETFPLGTNTPPEVSLEQPWDQMNRASFDPIDLLASTFDSTGYVDAVRFYLNNVLIATDSTYPFSGSWTPTGDGSFTISVIAEDDQGAFSAPDEVIVNIETQMMVQTLSLNISASAQDAEEDAAGNVNLSSDTLELVRGQTFAIGDQRLGFYFDNVNVPQNAKIVGARLSFTAAPPYNTHPIDLNIYGEATDNAQIFSNVNSNLSLRSLGSESVNWRPRIWIEQDSTEVSPDLSQIISEIVGRSGWQNGNALTLLMQGSGGRAAWSYDGDPAKAAKLDIWYQDVGSTLSLDIPPYLQSISDTSVVMVCKTSLAANLTVNIGPAPGNWTRSITDTLLQQEHHVLIGELNPNSTYYYQIQSGGQVLSGNDATHFFKTASDIPVPLEAWLIGSSGSGGTVAKGVRNAIMNANQQADLLLSLGDQADPDGGQLAYETNFFPVYSDILRNTPLFTITGDQEFANGNTDALTNSGPYFELFDLPADGVSGGHPSNTEAYYSFDHNGTHFIALDTDGSPFDAGSDVQNWLQQDLAQNTQPWTVVMLHHSPYSKSTIDSDTDARSISIRAELLDQLEEAGVDLIVSAGSYSYERSKLLRQHLGVSAHLTNAMLLDEGDGRPDGDGSYFKAATEKAAVYVNLGTSGRAGIGSLGHPAMAAESLQPGAALLQVNGNMLQMNFVDSTGAVVDSFRILKGIRPTVEITSPSQGRHFDFPTNDVDIEVAASDADGSISQVNFYLNGNLIASDGTAPFEYNWDQTAEGVYEWIAEAIDDDGLRTQSAPQYIFVGSTMSVCVPLRAGGDDAEELANGFMDLRQDTLNLGSHPVALRFQRPMVLPGATIVSAYLQFHAAASDATPASLQIEGSFEKGAYTGDSALISQLPLAPTSINWNVAPWTAGDMGLAQQSPDLQDLVQELINDADYRFSDPLNLLVSGNASRQAVSYDLNPDQAVSLCITYEFSPPPAPSQDYDDLVWWYMADESVYGDQQKTPAIDEGNVVAWESKTLGRDLASQRAPLQQPAFDAREENGPFNSHGAISFNNSGTSLQLPQNLPIEEFHFFLVQRSLNASVVESIFAVEEDATHPGFDLRKDGQQYELEVFF